MEWEESAEGQKWAREQQAALEEAGLWDEFSQLSWGEDRFNFGNLITPFNAATASDYVTGNDVTAGQTYQQLASILGLDAFEPAITSANEAGPGAAWSLDEGKFGTVLKEKELNDKAAAAKWERENTPEAKAARQLKEDIERFTGMTDAQKYHYANNEFDKLPPEIQAIVAPYKATTKRPPKNAPSSKSPGMNDSEYYDPLIEAGEDVGGVPVKIFKGLSDGIGRWG
jgi:hypothetical protein